MQEVRHEGVRVALSYPGSVRTEFMAAGRCRAMTMPGSSRQKTSPRRSPPSLPTPPEAFQAASRFAPRDRQETSLVGRRRLMSAFHKHRDALEVHETMMGSTGGRLAVALDLLTDALAMVGQHGVYCQNTRNTRKPTLESRSSSSRLATPRSCCRASSRRERRPTVEP